MAKHEWGVVHMGLVLDTVYHAMQKLIESPRLVLSEMHMMTIFEEFIYRLPPLREYHDFLYQKCPMKVMNCHSGTRVRQTNKMREEAFHPSLKTNQDTTNLVVELNKTLATAILEEFKTRKTVKVAWRYISEWNGYLSFAVLATEARVLDLGKEKRAGTELWS